MHVYPTQTENKMTENFTIDGDLFALYRWKVLLIFTFKPGVKIENALHRVKTFLKMVGDAHGHRISWVASLNETAWEGPIIYVCVAGVKTRIRENIRAFNRNSGHCHVLHSDFKGGIAYCDMDSKENPGVASFWETLENSPDQVLGALGLSDLRTAPRNLPTRFHALRSLARRPRRLS
jgi:hypothetical protein